MPAIVSCADFMTFLARKAEHIDEYILRDVTPVSSMVGMIETGTFPAFSGTEHEYLRFHRVFPDLSNAWVDKDESQCTSTLCDPQEHEIGMGYTKESYHPQRTSFRSPIFCFDQVITADYAKEQFAHYYSTLQEAQKLIVEDRYLCEMFRIAGFKWVAGGGATSGMTPFTFTEAGNLTTLTPNVLPTSALTVSMLKRRLSQHIYDGSLGAVVKDQPPEFEVLTDMETIWDLIQGDSNLKDNWQFQQFSVGSKEYSQYGWSGRVGNFMLKAALHPIRFQINYANNTLERVYPYSNDVATTEGIGGKVNQAYLDAPVQAHFIWHRRAFKNLVSNMASLNANMPFAARDLGGKWQFVMDNLSCGVDMNGNAIMVANERRNKGKFIADFEFASKKQFPEYAEMILALRAQACVIPVEPCGLSTEYPSQDYSSANPPCMEPGEIR